MFQVLTLFLTQVLLLILLAKLKIHKIIKLAIIFYCGFSPALVNSTFSLFSEIMTYPFVLLVILFVSMSWNAIFNKEKVRVFLLGIGTSLAFLFAAFNKAIFLYIFLIFLIPFLTVMCLSLIRKNRKLFVNSCIYLITGSVLFFICVSPYKQMNKRYNGNFVFTTRSDSLLFGNAYKRAIPLTSKVVVAHLTSIPGVGVCKIFFNDKECKYCEFHAADDFRGSTLNELLKNENPEDRKKKTIEFAFEKIRQQPLQYLFFMAVESSRMPFWESTQIGFVDYPGWLSQLFLHKGMRYGLRFIISLATLFSLVFIALRLFLKRSLIFDFSEEGKRMHICFFSMLMISVYTLLYSLFSVVTRYAFPIVPLYLLIIAYTIHKIFINQKKRS